MKNKRRTVLISFALFLSTLILICAFTSTSAQDNVGDSDSDGLLDLWEIQYLGGVEEGIYEDPDREGYDNQEEYEAGTGPRDATNKPEEGNNLSLFAFSGLAICGICAIVLGILVLIVVLIIVIIILSRRKSSRPKAPEQVEEHVKTLRTGKCKKCNSKDIDFLDDGRGECNDCGHKFTWKAPHLPSTGEEERRKPRKKGSATPFLCLGAIAILIVLLILGAIIVGAGLLFMGFGTEDEDKFEIASMDMDSGVPGAILTVSGTGFGTYGDILVCFTDDHGISIEVPSVDVTLKTVSVAVPPLITSDGGFSSGSYDIQVIKESGGKITKSNTLSGFHALELPNSGLPDGQATLIFLEAALEFARENRNGVQGTSLETTEMTSAVNAQLSNLESLVEGIRPVIQGYTDNYKIGTIGDDNIDIDLSSLAFVDRMIMGMLLAQSELDTDWESPVIDEGPVRSVTRSGDCFKAYYDALSNGQESNVNMASRGYFGDSARGPAEAFNTAYKVIGGTAAVAIGIAALFGAPAAALALPTAALLYVTLTGGMGEIGLGAALHNLNVPGTVDMIKNGINRVENCFRSKVESLIIPNAEGTIKSIFEGGKDVYESFVGKIEKPPIDQELVYQGPFTGNTVFTLTQNCPECGTVAYNNLFTVSGTVTLTATVNNNGKVTGTLKVTGSWTSTCSGGCPHLIYQEKNGLISSSGSVSGYISSVSASSDYGIMEGASGYMTAQSVSGELSIQTTAGSFTVPYTVYR